MNNKLYHPLWTHVPVIALLAAAVYYVLQAVPLPDRAPLHFNIGGQPDAFGSPWLAIGIGSALSVFYIILSIFLDELWARQESRKTFNWLSLFDEVVVGSITGFELSYVRILFAGDSSFPFPWLEVLVAAGLATAFAVVLELLRPYRQYKESVYEEDTSKLRADIAGRLRVGQPIAHWETQNPTWMSFLIVALLIVMFAGAVFSWAYQLWISIMLFVVGILSLTLYGGLQVLVNREFISVKLGILGIRLLRLDTGDIAAVEVHTFSPLHDFGGYGIRFNREMKAYYMRGNRGVKITTSGGKKFLIGSDHPDRLAAVVQAVSRDAV